MVREKVRRALIDSGYPCATVDECMTDSGELPKQIVDKYMELLNEEITNRLKEDPDYKKDRYEFLDKL